MHREERDMGVGAKVGLAKRYTLRQPHLRPYSHIPFLSVHLRPSVPFPLSFSLARSLTGVASVLSTALLRSLGVALSLRPGSLWLPGLWLCFFAYSCSVLLLFEFVKRRGDAFGGAHRDDAFAF